MKFEEAYTGCQEGLLTQVEAARLFGGCERTLKRQVIATRPTGWTG